MRTAGLINAHLILLIDDTTALGIVQDSTGTVHVPFATGNVECSIPTL